MFSPTVSDSPDDENSYVMSHSDDGITDFKINMNYGDYAEGMELEGNIYVSPSGPENEIFINPVYQSKDGQVYLVSGDGYCYSADEREDGSLYTQTIADKVTVNNNGKSKEFSTSVKISVAIMNPTVKVTIIQMDKDSKVLKKEDYKSGEVPKELKAERATDYIIVESTKTSKDGITEIERTIFSKSDDSFWYFFLEENKVFVKTYITILWNELGEQAEQE